jgi:hypothetical protein
MKRRRAHPILTNYFQPLSHVHCILERLR